MRHFGLHTLITLVQQKDNEAEEKQNSWSFLSPNARTQFRNSLLSFFREGIAPNSESYLLEKAVTLAVQLARREWHPHPRPGVPDLGWTTLITDIRGLHPLLALRFWRSIAQEVRDYSDGGAGAQRAAQMARCVCCHSPTVSFFLKDLFLSFTESLVEFPFSHLFEGFSRLNKVQFSNISTQQLPPQPPRTPMKRRLFYFQLSLPFQPLPVGATCQFSKREAGGPSCVDCSAIGACALKLKQ